MMGKKIKVTCLKYALSKAMLGPNAGFFSPVPAIREYLARTKAEVSG